MMRFLKTIFFTICTLLLFAGGTPVRAEESASTPDNAGGFDSMPGYDSELGSMPGYDGETGFELHMLDVGQGLSVLIKADGRYLLYDGGGAKTSSFVVSYLKQQGVSDLDYIVVSHYDDDHLNGIVGALHVFDCGTILSPDYTADTDIYRSYISAVEENGAPVLHPLPGDTCSLGSASVEILGPSSYDNASENNNCISLCIDYAGFRFLLCGDLEAEGEENLVSSGADLSCDLYVVNHHGSAFSSTFYFLNQALPNYAFLSCGADNPYGHPAAETMERLQSMDCELYRTDKQGTVVAYSDGSSLWFSTDPCTDFGDGDSPIESESTAADSSGNITYVCNTNTHKFHYAYCDSVDQMKEKNKLVTTESRDSLIAQGYVPCKNCCP